MFGLGFERNDELIWLDSRHDRLSQMAASEEITDDDARQMIMDLDQAYHAFVKFLNDQVHLCTIQI